MNLTTLTSFDELGKLLSKKSVVRQRVEEIKKYVKNSEYCYQKCRQNTAEIKTTQRICDKSC